MDNSYQDSLNQILNKIDLTEEKMISLMEQLMTGQLVSSQIASFMIAMRMKGETIDEIAAAAKVMRRHSKHVLLDNTDFLIDTCGTGGDSLQTFNISTLSAVIAATVGAKVAKHGGRSVSSKCGSADVLESLGVNVNVDEKKMAQLVNEVGIGFMFAPNFHPAMKYVASVRKELGVRTMFNMLGPLTNPANSNRQIIGVFNDKLCHTFAHVLKKLGSKHVLIVYGHDGMDEISITGKTSIAELKENEIFEYEIHPTDFGLKVGKLDDIKVENVEESKKIIMDILAGTQSTARDIVVLNAGAAIYVSGITEDITSGIDLAKRAIDSGKAQEKLAELVTKSNG